MPSVQWHLALCHGESALYPLLQRFCRCRHFGKPKSSAYPASHSYGPHPHATGCYLWMGSTGAGCDNLYNSAEKVVTRYTFTRVPLNGELNYVRLIANFKGVWTQNDYVYTAQ